MVSKIGHELGVLFGFVGIILLATAAYAVGWQVSHRRHAKEEAERRADLSAKGINEKATARDVGVNPQANGDSSITPGDHNV